MINHLAETSSPTPEFDRASREFASELYHLNHSASVHSIWMQMQVCLGVQQRFPEAGSWALNIPKRVQYARPLPAELYPLVKLKVPVRWYSLAELYPLAMLKTPVHWHLLMDLSATPRNTLLNTPSAILSSQEIIRALIPSLKEFAGWVDFWKSLYLKSPSRLENQSPK